MGVDAEIDNWDSSALKNFSLSGITLDLGNGVEIEAEHAEFKLASVLGALRGKPEVQISIPKITAKKDIFSAKFSADDWTFSRADGGISQGITSIELQKNGKTFRRGAAKFKFQNASKIPDKSSENSIINFLETVADGNLEIRERGDDKKLRPVGKIVLRDGLLTGKIDLDLSIFENIFDAKISGDSACNIYGNVTEKTFTFEPKYDFSISPPDDALATVLSRSFSVLRFNGDAKLTFSQEKFAAERVTAKISAEIAGNTAATLTEISLAKPLTLLIDDKGNITVDPSSAQGKIAQFHFAATPISIIAPAIDELLSQQLPAASISDIIFSGDLDLISDATGGLSLNSSSPLRLAGIVHCGNEKPQTLFLEFPLEASFLNGRTTVQISDGQIFHNTNDDAQKSFDGSFQLALVADDLNANSGEFSGFLDLNENFAAFCENTGFDGFFRGRKFGSQASLDAKIFPKDISITKFHFLISDVAQTPSRILSVRTQNIILSRDKALEMPLNNPFEIEAYSFPLDLINPLTGKFAFEGTLTGTLTATRESDGMKFRNDEGCEINDFFMRRSDELLLKGLSLKSGKSFVSVGFDNEKKCHTIVDLKGAKLENSDDDTTVARGDLFLSIIGTAIEQIRGKVSGELGEIFAQPLLNNFDNIGSGIFLLDASVNSSKKTGSFDLSVSNLSSKYSAFQIDNLALSFEHIAGEDTDARAKLSFSATGESEIRAKFSNFDFDLDTHGITFSGDILSSKLELADAFILYQIFHYRAGSVDEEEPRTHTQTPSEKSLSSHARTVSGTAKFHVAKISAFGKPLGSLNGEFSISSQNTNAQFNSTNILSGKLKGTFEKTESEQNASANFNFSLRNADLGELFDILPIGVDNPNEPPATGRFSAIAQGNTISENPDELLQNLNWSAKLSGKNGQLRIFKLGGGNTQIVEDIATVGGNLVGLFGNLTENAAPQASRMATATHALQKYLANFPFDECTAEAHGNAAIIRVGRLDVKSDLLCVAGNGEIFPQDDLPAKKWNSNFTFQIKARGELADLLEATNTATGTDPDGYTLGPNVKVSGPLEDIANRPPTFLN